MCCISELCTPLPKSLPAEGGALGAKVGGRGRGVPPWREPVCTCGRAGTDAVRTRAREKRETKRTTDLQLLLPIARGAFCFAFLSRTWPCTNVVVGSVAARPTEKVSFWWFRGGGTSPVLATSGVQSLASRELSPYGLLLEEKYFLTEQQCRREDRAQKSIRVNFFLRSAAFRGRSQLTRGQPSGDSCSTKSSSRRQV